MNFNNVFFEKWVVIQKGCGWHEALPRVWDQLASRQSELSKKWTSILLKVLPKF